jgi:hypothetical protein
MKVHSIRMLAAIALLFVGMQENVPPPQADIDKAIKEGTEYVIARCKNDLSGGDLRINSNMGLDYSALMLYTLVHSGISLEDETVKRLLARVLGAPLIRTYPVAITAAALAAIDPVKYQAKLAQCAQYLVDWQCDNGQWGYGDKYEPEVKAGSGDGGKGTVAKIQIKRIKKLGPLVGDNSNSQYAALGLKACAAGGCEIEAAVLSRAIEWWEKSQQNDGGWSYHSDGVYQKELGVYGSMTAGAVSSLIILKQIKNSDPRIASSVTRGVGWMSENFTVENNARALPNRGDWQHYYLYGMERVGDLYPTEKFGKRAWYAIGAAYLLRTQKPDGSWVGPNPDMAVADTCFALLFLERVTRRPPVATGGKSPPPPAK